MSRSTATALQRQVSAFLTALIAEHRTTGQPHLPPARSLAASAGVSYPTMQGALGSLAKQGIVAA
jgi:DNA-binding transcriptional regulator YhcF (GntR family)